MTDLHDRYEEAKRKDEEMTRRGTSLKAHALMNKMAKIHEHQEHDIDEVFKVEYVLRYFS